MENPKEILCIRDLAVGYGSFLLRGVNATLYEGQRLLLDGPSGSGKTSLLRVLLGLPVPAEGSIRIMGRLLNKETVWDLRRKIGYVPQEPQLGTVSVRSFFERALSFHANRSIHPERNDLERLMEYWQLSRELLKKPCPELSGGEKQRVALVLVMLLKREILLLDEPTSALDRECRRILYHWVNQSGHLSFVIVSHDPGLQELADDRIDLTAFRAERAHG